MPDNGIEPKQNNRDGLALVLGVIFIIGLVFATYTYFNKNATNNADLSSEESSALDKLKDIISSKTQRDDTTKKDAITDKKDQPQVAGTSTTTVGPVWVATDYKNGDIKSGNYTVKRGDTLWEIAEAVYGDGTQWTKILEANKGSIGFLPNGSQALIVTGQALNIP